jgi:hypothetical protein
MRHKSKAITAQNQFTDWLKIDGPLLVIVNDTSSMDMTVVVQVSLDEGTTAVDTGSTLTAEGGIYADAGFGLYYRVGVKTGGFTSGTATVHLIA